MPYQVWARGAAAQVVALAQPGHTGAGAAHPRVPRLGQRYYLSRRRLTAAPADAYGRGHGAIDNALPWQLAVAFGEEDHLLRHHQAAQNLALVRKMARNLVKLDPTNRRIKPKRLAWDEPFLEDVLAALGLPGT